jgi:bifunctional NMN adenylyltransferase/nudix hydrolase
MSKYRYKTAVYIGRFQPIHTAHVQSIFKALEIAERVVILIGSSNKSRDIKNPWDRFEREKMIRKALGEEHKEWSDYPEQHPVLSRIRFDYIRDYMYNDYKWSAEVYSRAIRNGAGADHSTVLVGCMKDDSSYYLKMFPQWAFHRMPYIDKIDATDIRNELFETSTLNEQKQKVPVEIQSDVEYFIKGNEELTQEYKWIKQFKQAYAHTPYPVTFVTVDSLVIKSGCILVIERGRYPGKGLLALPGGYLNINERILDGAVRELKEETSIAINADDLRTCLKSTHIFDHPKRSHRGRIVTHAHLFDLGYGPLPDVIAKDDASKAMWIPLGDVLSKETAFFEDHFDIIFQLTSKY